MNLHALTFEQILRVCASLENPKDMRRMIEALEILEKNIRYQRQGLAGRLNEMEIRSKRKRQQDRQALKQSLRVIRGDEKDGPDRGGSS